MNIWFVFVGTIYGTRMGMTMNQDIEVYYV